MKILLGLCVSMLMAALSPPCWALEDEAVPFPARGKVPPGYAPAYEATIRAAENEGKLVIYSTTDADVARPLIEDFKAMYPKIDIEYDDLNSTELHHRFIAETQLGPDSADVLWSSAMDQQASLVSNGYALAYESPESAGLPAWAKWKDQAYATTFEPVAIVYNKNLLPAADVPRTHADVARLLGADPNRFKGKVVTYDIEKSGLGFFLATQDVGVSPVFWDIAQALGKAQTRLAVTTDAMVKRVASGQAVMAYNVIGSYALAQARKNPALGIVFPGDYTLVMSRIVFINKKAANPNAARLWLDYVLSRRGQTVIANRAGLYAVRGDVGGDNTAARLTQLLGASVRPIPLGPSLIGYVNNQNYRDFLRQWRKALNDGVLRDAQ
jgi:iron(III) transport system substrate-binding protein